MILCTADDAARTYRLPARTIRRWVKEGRMVDHSILATHHRARVIIDIAELEQLLAHLGRAAHAS